jgi:hypothetical protein
VTEALALIVLVWAGMLVAGALRSRNASPHVTVGGFERAMGVLGDDGRFAARTSGGAARSGRFGGRQVMVPGAADRIVERDVNSNVPTPGRVRPEDPMIARRRMWFERALAVTGVLLVAALAFGGFLWGVTLVALAVTGAYVAVLRRLKLQRDEARRVVRELELGRDEVRTIHLPDDVAVGAGGAATSGTVRVRRWDD